MKKFSFRLESVLRVRRIEEDLAKNELIKANNEVRKAIQHLEDRRAAYEAVVSGSSGQGGSLHASRTVLSVDDVLAARNRAELSGQRLIAAEIALEDAKQSVIESRQKYAEAAARTKAIEKLRARALDQFNVDSLRDEQNELDDIASARRLVMAGEGQ